MKIRVRIAGSLNRTRFPNHDHLRGMEIDLPPNSKVNDLFSSLGIRYSRLVNVSIDGEAKKWDDKIQEGALVDIYLRLGGG